MDMRFGTWNVRNLYRAGSEDCGGRSLEIQGRFTGSTGGQTLNQQANIHFAMERGMKIMN
jgi:hypothetical protein